MKDLPPAFREIPPGPELVESLGEAFASHRGWVHATGFVENVELKLATSGADVRREFDGRFALSHLGGPLGGPYGATLARLEGGRVETLAGILLRAVSGGVSALCVSASAVVVERAPKEPPPPGPPLHRPPAAPEPALSAFAARVAARRSNDDDDDDDDEQEYPSPGDLVEHFAFGLCEVLKVDGDRLLLRDQRAPGRIREIASERLSISGPVERAGKRLFRLSRR